MFCTGEKYKGNGTETISKIHVFNWFFFLSNIKFETTPKKKNLDN